MTLVINIVKVFFGTVPGMHSETLPYLQNTLVQFAQSGLSSDSSWNQPKPIRHLLNRCNSWPPVHSQCPQLSGSGYSLISQIFQSVFNREGVRLPGSPLHDFPSGTVMQGLFLHITY